MPFMRVVRSMCHRLLCPALLFGLLCLADQSLAQPIPQQEQASSSESVLSIGQSLDAVMAILKQQRLAFSEGGFAFAQGDPDRSNLHVTLDAEHTVACIYFSKSTKKTTGISLVVFPSRQTHAKGNESWLEVRELGIHEDGSYSARFAPPRQVPRSPAKTD